MGRKCSRDDCPRPNIKPDYTVICFCCSSQIHLICYDVVKPPKEIFVNKNIVMVCDDCLENNKEGVSPKRKQSNSIQRNTEQQNQSMSLQMNPPCKSTPPKNATTNQNQQMQEVIESLVQKIETNTATIAGLKTSVDSMNDTISEQKTTVRESIKLNSENYSSIKQSYAEMLRDSIKNSGNQTPKTTRPFRTQKPTHTKTPKPNKPTLKGTSQKVIGKPPSPNKIRSNVPPKHDKAVWISRLHRDTTEDEMASYIKDSIGITSVDQCQIRKLVKKDRDLSTYSFVSFKIACPENIYNTLMDAEKWPSYCQIREFDMDLKTSMGVKLNVESTANNDESSKPDEQNLNNSKNEESQMHEAMDAETVQ